MPRKRKTIEVDALKDKVNGYLALDTVSREAKVGLSILLESVLMDTGNYKGYRYLGDVVNYDSTDAYNRRYF